MVAGIAFAAYAVIDKESVVLASSVPAILFVGGIGAFVKSYLVWRDGGTWPIWQGAGWFLLTLMLVCLSVPWSAATFACAEALLNIRDVTPLRFRAVRA